jgi:hypothetical protein
MEVVVMVMVGAFAASRLSAASFAFDDPAATIPACGIRSF